MRIKNILKISKEIPISKKICANGSPSDNISDNLSDKLSDTLSDNELNLNYDEKNLENEITDNDISENDESERDESENESENELFNNDLIEKNDFKIGINQVQISSDKSATILAGKLRLHPSPDSFRNRPILNKINSKVKQIPNLANVENNENNDNENEIEIGEIGETSKISENDDKSKKIKYPPCKYYDFFKIWLDKIEAMTLSTQQEPLLVTGPPGSGKTYMVKEYFRLRGYNLYIFDTSNITKNRMIEEAINKIYATKNMSKLMRIKLPQKNRLNSDDNKNDNNHESVKTAIIIDELEGISINDRGCMTYIINLIKNIKKYEKWNKIPLICIGNNKYIKKMKDLSKLCEHVIIKKVTVQTTYEMFNLNNITFKNDDELKDAILWCQGDYRRIEYLIRTSKWSSFKTKDLNLYEITEKLLYESSSIPQLIRHYNNEKIFLPLMIHQNYKDAVMDTIVSAKKAVVLSELSKYISESDVIGKYIYIYNEWDIGAYYALLSCYKISTCLQHNRNIGTGISMGGSNKHSKSVVGIESMTIDNNNLVTNKPAILSTLEDIDKIEKVRKIDFTKLLNRTSLQFTYKHTFHKCIIHFNDYYMDHGIIRYNCYKIKYLFDQGRTTEANELLTYFKKSNKSLLETKKDIIKMNKCM
jgi:hypothetical protein